jgi:hypothetical protein
MNSAGNVKETSVHPKTTEEIVGSLRAFCSIGTNGSSVEPSPSSNRPLMKIGPQAANFPLLMMV